MLLARLSLVLDHVLRNVFDVLLVSINHLFGLNHFFVHLFDLGVILLDSILKPLSGLREWQVHLVSLELEIIFLFEERLPLFFQMLGSLFESVLSQPCLSLCKSSVCLFELVSGVIDFLSKNSIFFLQLLVLVSLLRVQIVKS